VTLRWLDLIWKKLKDFATAGKPIWGTCAGCILLSNHVSSSLGGGSNEGDRTLSSVSAESLYGEKHIGGIEINTCRNFFGRQSKSFEIMTKSSNAMFDRFPAMFIRAPAIVSVGEEAQILASISYHGEDVIVAVRQNNLLATCFHPELTEDLRIHRFFLSLVNRE
jgi:5'-phosphate synthase pdxT subunit